MPLYFAYGANLDHVGMAQRCPGASPLGPASIAAFRFLIMAEGYATIVPDAASKVHGLLWQLRVEDFEALDAFEEVEAGLYRRCLLTVRHGSHQVEAALYRATSVVTGVPRPGYMEAVLAAAATCGLPLPYRTELAGWLTRA